ncbi:MAG TPA: hypothetical protein VGK32_04885 [Vicinamibacterales bacterium]
MTTRQDGPSRTQHWARFTLVLMASWLLVGSSLLVVRGLVDVSYKGYHDWPNALLGVAGNWGLNALLTPLVVWGVRLVPFERGRIGPAPVWNVFLLAIVNLERVQELVPASRGEHFVRLTGGIDLKLTRNYRERLEQLLGDRL